MKTIVKRNRRHRIRKKQRSGTTAVEFAIVANIFFVMIFTCMEFARMNMVRNLSQDAAYFAARHAMVPGATEAEAIQAADEVMSMMVSGGYTVDVGELGSDADDVTVTVTVDFDDVALFAPKFLPNTQIQSVARVYSERYDGFFEQ
ncbi:MAG: TadE/TadG family type IV pilus assembly protein [Planctomycetota bacterium]